MFCKAVQETGKRKPVLRPQSPAGILQSLCCQLKAEREEIAHDPPSAFPSLTKAVLSCLSS